MADTIGRMPNPSGQFSLFNEVGVLVKVTLRYFQFTGHICTFQEFLDLGMSQILIQAFRVCFTGLSN